METFSFASVGAQTKHVHCEQCGTEYEYQCVRRAVGSSSTPYGIRAEKARSKARAESEEKLRRRLVAGVDPVPCPHCGWFQHAMAAEMNRRRHRWMLWVGGTVALLAGMTAGFSLIYDLSTNQWESVSRWTRGFVLDTLMVAAAGVTLAVMVRRVIRVDLNAAWPDKVAPPAGAPRAFAPGESRSPLEILQPTDVSADGWLTVQLLGLRHPPLCCKCSASTPSIHEFPLNSREGKLPVRICDNCNRSCKRRQTWGTLVVALVGGGACAAGGYYISQSITRDSEWLAGTIGGGAAGTIFCAIIATIIIRRIVRPVRFRRFSAVRNTVELKFRNRGYAEAMAATMPPVYTPRSTGGEGKNHIIHPSSSRR